MVNGKFVLRLKSDYEKQDKMKSKTQHQGKETNELTFICESTNVRR